MLHGHIMILGVEILGELVITLLIHTIDIATIHLSGQTIIGIHTTTGETTFIVIMVVTDMDTTLDTLMVITTGTVMDILMEE